MAARTPLAEVESSAGATFVERFGLELPERYGDPEAEYRAVREGVGLLDGGLRGLLTLTGSERLRWLNGQVSNDVSRLAPGAGLLAAALTVKGRILADLAVLAQPDAVWVDCPRERAGVLRQTFDRHIIADDVAVEEATDRFARCLVMGPGAPALMATLVGSAADVLPPWHHAEVRIGGAAATLVATRWLGTPGFDLLLPAQAAGAAWAALRQAGAVPVGLAALEPLRIEAGWAWCGVDFDESHLLLEALTPDHVSFTKGCYLGQEVVIRIQHQGHLNRRLCGLWLDGPLLPDPGAPILAGQRPVGCITSAARSPALRRVVALGYVRREHWEPGTRLRIPVAGEAEVTPLPLPPAAA